jgi:hypothetical protein
VVGSRNGRTHWPTPFGTQTEGTPFFMGIPSACGYVPKKESKERFSSMITTTWQILWMPLLDGGQPVCAEEPEPQPAATPAASRSRTTVVAALS